MTDKVISQQISRLSQMDGWPFHAGGQLELERIASRARSEAELARTITEISEKWPRCPTAKQLAAELAKLQELPEKCGACSPDCWVSREVCDPNTGKLIWIAARCSCPRGRQFAASAAGAK